MAEALDGYLQRIEAGLKSGNCRREVDQVLAEARTHLEECVDELVARGLSRPAAEETAIARFGDAEAVCRWYAEVHRRPTMLRAALVPFGVLGLFLITEPIVFSISVPAIVALRLGFINFFLIAMIVVCYRSGRFTLPVLAGGLGLCSLCFWIGFLIFSVPAPGDYGGFYPVSRSSVQSRIREAQAEVFKLDRELAVLEEGSRVFASPTPPADAGIFQDSNGSYRTPIYFELSNNPKLTVYVHGQRSDGVVREWRLARQYWGKQKASPWEVAEHLDVSPYVYVRGVIRDRRVQQKLVDDLPALAHQPWTQNVRPFALSALFMMYTPAFLAILGDTIGGCLRMLAQLLRRRRQRGLV